MTKQLPKVNNIFLIGAGFTKAVFPIAPLNSNLLQFVIDNNPETPLKKYNIRYNTDDIEILLTRMDLEREELSREQLGEDRKKINENLAECFEQFRFGKGNNRLVCERDWIKQFATEVFKPNDVIVSLNYDCFLEGLLDHYKMWSPINGYSSSINVGNYNGHLPENPKGIIIHKIHGSENFKSHDKEISISPVLCGELFESFKNRLYSQIDPSGPYIIAPSFVKRPHEDIERMMIEVLDVVDTAKNFIIIGCRIRSEDAFLWLLLTKFLYRHTEDRKVIIIAPEAVDIKEKINNHYWGGNEVTNVVDINYKLENENILDELVERLKVLS